MATRRNAVTRRVASWLHWDAARVNNRAPTAWSLVTAKTFVRRPAPIRNRCHAQVWFAIRDACAHVASSSTTMATAFPRATVQLKLSVEGYTGGDFRQLFRQLTILIYERFL